MEYINFDLNYNHKLKCHSFSTIRIYDPKFNLWHNYDIRLKQEHIGVVKITSMNIMKIEELTEQMIVLDADMNRDGFIRSMGKHYKDNPKWKKEKTVIQYIILSWIWRSSVSWD